MAEKVKIARGIMRKYPEVEFVVCQMGRPDDGTDPTGFYNAEFFVPLKPPKDWPAVKDQDGWRGWLHPHRPRTKDELIDEMNAELNRHSDRRRLELLAEHPRQRHGSALGRERRELGQDLRTRPRRAGTAGGQS